MTHLERAVLVSMSLAIGIPAHVRYYQSWKWQRGDGFALLVMVLTNVAFSGAIVP